MAKLILTDGDNNEYRVNGRMSFDVTKGLNSSGEVILMVEGTVATHKYIEDIVKIESNRFLLEDIEVVKEHFGTNDFNILYEFMVPEDKWTIKEEYLSEKAIQEIEERLYEDDESDSYELIEELTQQAKTKKK